MTELVHSILATISDLSTLLVPELLRFADGGLISGFAVAAGTVGASTRGEPLEQASLDVLEELEIFNQAIASVRVIAMKDSHTGERDEWLRNAFSKHVIYEFSEDDTSSITTVNHDFNVLVLAGNDISRMRQFIAQNHAILVSRVKICLMRASNARRRAQALMAGFDDVFDIGRTRPLEASIRTFSIWNRYQIAQVQNNASAALHLALQTVCKLDQITPRQRRCIECLFEAKGRLVSYRQLSDRIGSGEVMITDTNLKVIICNLRKQLLPGCSIKADHGVGYRLIVEPNGESEGPLRWRF